MNVFPKVSEFRREMPGGVLKSKVLQDLDELHTEGRISRDDRLLQCAGGVLSIQHSDRLIRLQDHAFVIVPGEPYVMIWYSETSTQVYKLKRNIQELRYDSR